MLRVSPARRKKGVRFGSELRVCVLSIIPLNATLQREMKESKPGFRMAALLLLATVQSKVTSEYNDPSNPCKSRVAEGSQPTSGYSRSCFTGLSDPPKTDRQAFLTGF